MTYTTLTILLCISAHIKISHQELFVENGCNENISKEMYPRRICNSHTCRRLIPIVSKTITCNNVSVDSLKLYKASPEELFQPPYPLTFKVVNSNISVLPMSTFPNARSITTLFMENIKLETILPTAFNHLDQLKEIYLRRNELTTITDGIFNTLTMLEKLDLSNNRIESISNHAFVGVNLTNLDLSHNNISGLGQAVLDSIRHLSVLNMSYNNLKDISSFGVLDVSTFNLSHNNIDSVDFEIFLDAAIVDLSFNNISGLRNFSACEAKIIILSHNQISDFEKNEYVNTLDLSHNKIRNIGSDVLSENLIEFHVSFNFIPSLNVDTFFGLFNLTTLDLGHNNLSSLPNSCFKDLISLKRLNLSNNRFTVFDFGTFDDLLNLEVLDISSNDIKQLPQVHSMKSLTHLYIQNNEISDIIIYDFIHKHSIKLLYMNLNDNSWPCQTLIGILRLLEAHNVSFSYGNYRDGSNIRGIKCINTTQKFPLITEETNFNDSNLNSFFNEGFTKTLLYKFFNEGFKESEFFKYLEGLNKSLNAQRIDYTAFNKMVQELSSKSNYVNAENSTLIKYLDNYRQSTNKMAGNEEGRLTEIANLLRLFIKDLEKANKFNEGMYNSTEFRTTNAKYLESLNGVARNSKDTTESISGKLTSSYKNTTNPHYIGLLSVIAILLLIIVCIMVTMVYQQIVHVTRFPSKKDEVELI